MMPYQECPRFHKCNANKCLLDPLFDERKTLEGEEVCGLNKPARIRIGSKYKDLLPYGGRTKRSFQAQNRYQASIHPHLGVYVK